MANKQDCCIFQLDTEFIEDGHSIDLISLALSAGEYQTYYAQSVEFEESKASDWVRANVLAKLWQCKSGKSRREHAAGKCQPGCPWRTRAEMRDEVLAFVTEQCAGKKPQFQAWYSAYDHVALCQLFGTMMDLPKGWPMYTFDLKQWADQLGDPQVPTNVGVTEHHALFDAQSQWRIYDFLRAIAAGKDQHTAWMEAYGFVVPTRQADVPRETNQPAS